jgi:RNA polymerase sigma factor (sigma-70 family)
MAAVLLFFRVYLYIYQPEVKPQRSEQEIFNRFSARHDLSAREREVLRFLLEEKTNKEIAEELSISEGTVKYHIHNLLQKTSCRNRLGLLSAFTAEQDT